MKNSTIQLLLSENEFKELTRLIYLAQYMVDSCYDMYEHKVVMEALMQKVFRMGYELFPDSGLYTKSLEDEGELSYSFTIKMEEETEMVVDAFNDEVYYDRMSTDLTDRDFKEKYGNVSDEAMLYDKEMNDFFDKVQDFYREELEENGLTRLRLII